MNYQNFLFVGSRGEYDGVDFEVLGHGSVDYTLQYTQWAEDSHEVGQEYQTQEYYCLANTGEIWYFSIQSEEVYLCRQLDSEAIKKLEVQSLVLDESGMGVLNEYKGRALLDYLQYNSFQYFDYSRGSQFYSKDVFEKDGKQEIEWFWTTKIDPNKLPEIFRKTLELDNPKIAQLLKQKADWNRLFWVALVSLIGLIIGYIIVVISHPEVAANTVYVDTSSVSDPQALVEFDAERSRFYSITTEVNQPAARTSNLTFTVELPDGSIQKKSLDITDQKHTLRSTFFAPQDGVYRLTYQVSTTSAEPATDSSKMTTIVKQSGVDPIVWFLSFVLITASLILIAIIRSRIKTRLRKLQYVRSGS